MKNTLRVAILDLNNNETNRGIGYIKHSIESYGDKFEWTLFDVRHKLEIADLNFDVYVSSGGPGSPFDFSGSWNVKYFSLLSDIVSFNATASEKTKKHVFFICHSFQIACQFFKVGTITARNSKSFGTFPCYRTAQGAKDDLLKNLNNPFWIADFRDYQVLNTHPEVFEEKGFKLLAREMPQTDKSERAIMAIRFSDTIVGTQFHPEADAKGMLTYFQLPDRKETIVKNFGMRRYNTMVRDLADKTKIESTFNTVLPYFFDNALKIKS